MCAPLSQWFDAGASAPTGQAWVMCTSLELLPSIQTTRTESMCVHCEGAEREVGRAPQRIKVLASEEVRMLGSRHRHRGSLTNQTFPLASLGVGVSSAGKNVTLTSFPWGPYLQPRDQKFPCQRQQPCHPFHAPQSQAPCLTPRSPASCFLCIGDPSQQFHTYPSDICLSHQVKAPQRREAGVHACLTLPCVPSRHQCMLAE